jgi:aromatic-L-amino-acid/L-tryptophan decarboxylase
MAASDNRERHVDPHGGDPMRKSAGANTRSLVGDMPTAELREYGHQVIDWIAEYLEEIESYPVLARVRPGEVTASLPTAPPDAPTGMDEILRDFRDRLVPGVTHWNHPGFMAYFGITGSGPGILGELLAAALNTNAMLWHTGPSSTELEQLSLDWLRQMVGLPEGFHGHIQDTASTSTLVALAAAREAAGLGIRENGLSGRDLPRLRVYCSDQAHSVVDKACITLGLGVTGTRRIPTDADFRMEVGALETAIREDVARGDRPIAVVATVGTTSTTSVDPVPQVAEICRRHGLWLHVDAAYGGAAAVVPEMRWVFAGCELADSIVINPHKWLFVPVDCSALLVRDPTIVRRAFAYSLQILRTEEADEVTNLMELGPALGRRFRALKLWMVLRYFGRRGIVERLRAHIALARWLAERVEAEPGWEVLAPVHFSTVCLRYRGELADESEIERINERILAAVNASGEVYISQTRLRGTFALRVAIGNLRTGERHVSRVWELLRESAASGI